MNNTVNVNQSIVFCLFFIHLFDQVQRIANVYLIKGNLSAWFKEFRKLQRSTLYRLLFTRIAKVNTYIFCLWVYVFVFFKLTVGRKFHLNSESIAYLVSKIWRPWKYNCMISFQICLDSRYRWSTKSTSNIFGTQSQYRSERTGYCGTWGWSWSSQNPPICSWGQHQWKRLFAR